MFMQITGLVLISVQFPGPRLSPRIKMCGNIAVWGDAVCWGPSIHNRGSWSTDMWMLCVLPPSQTCNHSSSEVTLDFVWIWWEYGSCYPDLPLRSPLCISACLFSVYSAYFSSWLVQVLIHACLTFLWPNSYVSPLISLLPILYFFHWCLS